MRGFSSQGRRALLLLCYRRVRSAECRQPAPKYPTNHFCRESAASSNLLFYRARLCAVGAGPRRTKLSPFPSRRELGDVNTEGLSKSTFRNRAICICTCICIAAPFCAGGAFCTGVRWEASLPSWGHGSRRKTEERKRKSFALDHSAGSLGRTRSFSLPYS